MNAWLVVGVISILIGAGLIYWINKRKFYRRNVAGLEGFSSFEVSVLVRVLERLGKWIAYILIIFGILNLLIYGSEKKRKEKKEVHVSVTISPMSYISPLSSFSKNSKKQVL